MMALLRRPADPDSQPLGRRLRAWWRGDILSLLGSPNPQPANTPWGDPHIPAPNPGHWDAESLKAAQMIWGHALLGPSSPDELAALAALVKPRRNTRIALMGAGLGGLSLALSRICHCRVTGFEQAEVLLRLCPDRNEGHLRALDSITVRTERSFDHAIIDGLGHRAGDVFPLLKPAAALISARGSMIVRAYCVTSEAVRTTESHQRWIAAEPVAPHVPTRAELDRTISRLGFEIVEEADVADMHVAAVDACWAPAVDLLRLLHCKPNQRNLVPALVAEAERWRERLEMIRAGEIAVVELQARRITTASAT